MNILIGCPTYKREWIARYYMDYVTSACYLIGWEPGFVFVVSRQEDIVALRGANRRNCQMDFIVVEEPDRDPQRDWSRDRVHHMVELRNILLARVREVDPGLFWSLDSDILVNADALHRRTTTAPYDTWDAFGQKCYLSTVGKNTPNYAMFNRQGGMRRKDTDGMHYVDVLMADVIMQPPAYNVDYEFDRNGEDLGWSAACARQKLRLLFDGTVANKHVMRPDKLHVVDPRVGW